MNRHGQKAFAKLESESVLLIGMIYHCYTSPVEYHPAILKDALKRAHTLHNGLRAMRRKQR